MSLKLEGQRKARLLFHLKQIRREVEEKEQKAEEGKEGENGARRRRRQELRQK